MPDRLQQVLSFAAVAPGAQQNLSYLLSVQGVPVLPDWVFVDTPGFSVVTPVGLGSLSVQNNTLVAASCNVWLCRLHTIQRAFGNNATQNLSPQPFIVYSNAASGGSSSTVQAFRYTATGAEGTDFFITLPAARASDLYRIVATPAGMNTIIPFDLPDVLAGDRTTTQFRCVTAAGLTLNDQIDVLVTDAT